MQRSKLTIGSDTPSNLTSAQMNSENTSQ